MERGVHVFFANSSRFLVGAFRYANTYMHVYPINTANSPRNRYQLVLSESLSLENRVLLQWFSIRVLTVCLKRFIFMHWILIHVSLKGPYLFGF